MKKSICFFLFLFIVTCSYETRTSVEPSLVNLYWVSSPKNCFPRSNKSTNYYLNPSRGKTRKCGSILRGICPRRSGVLCVRNIFGDYSSIEASKVSLCTLTSCFDTLSVWSPWSLVKQSKNVPFKFHKARELWSCMVVAQINFPIHGAICF